MNQVVIETQLLPSLEYFCAVWDAGRIQIEHFEHYQKQSYRNHCLINTANGVVKLIVPVMHLGNHALIKDMKVDFSSRWLNNFWRTIESAYRKSPYFEHYADNLREILPRKETFLVDLNNEILGLCFTWLGLDKESEPTQSYNKTIDSIDLRNVLLSKKPYSTRNFYRPVPYVQVFGNVFKENLSILDLIFCKGPGARGIIMASRLNQ
jgi:hypothetical protein